MNPSRTIPWWQPQIEESAYPMVKEILQSNFLNDGNATAQFENKIAELLGTRHAVSATSGTTALYLALMALGIGKEDEVIVPDITFIATANAVTMTGAQPVLVDVDPTHLTLSPEAVQKSITPKTKAIIPVHVSGRGGTIQQIVQIAQKNNLPIVEDAAEALGSKHHGKFLGTHGTLGCFSFSPNKTITTGQGGIVVTNDEKLYLRLRELKDQGRPVRGTGGADIHPTLGFNFKFTNLQAAVGLSQLQVLSPRMQRLRRTYEIYHDELADLSAMQIFPLDNDEIPQWTDALVEHRDELEKFLNADDIHCRKFWFPIHTQKPYLLPDDNFPHSTRLSPRALWLPSAFQLTDNDILRVCQRIKTFYKS